MDKKGREGAVGGKAVNNVINVLLAIGCLTILFPLYMTIIIAFKKPSEMTNDVAGALGFPANWNFDNFVEAMRVTDFWRSLGNSLLLTGVTVIICILLHSLAGYVIGRKMARHKIFQTSYFYIVSGMFVPFAVLMMPLVKQTSQLGLANRAGVILLYVVFFMPMNVLLYSGYLRNIPIALEEAACVDGAGVWQTYWKIIFPNMKPMHATVAVLTAMSTWNDVMTPLVIMSGSDVWPAHHRTHCLWHSSISSLSSEPIIILHLPHIYWHFCQYLFSILFARNRLSMAL